MVQQVASSKSIVIVSILVLSSIPITLGQAINLGLELISRGVTYVAEETIWEYP